MRVEAAAGDPHHLGARGGMETLPTTPTTIPGAGAEMRAVVQAIPDLLIRLDASGAVLDIRMEAATGAAARDRADDRWRQKMLAAHVDVDFAAAAKRAIENKAIVSIEYARDGGATHYEA